MFDSALQLWLTIGLLLVLIATPTGVGLAIFKLYRRHHPHAERQQQVSPSHLYESLPYDGFIKVSAVGWLVCAPVYLLLYLWV